MLAFFAPTRLASRLHYLPAARRQNERAQTDSAANQFGASQSAQPRAANSVVRPLSAARYISIQGIDYERLRRTAGRSPWTHHLVNSQPGLSAMRRKDVGIPVRGKMPQKLARRMAMGESGHPTSKVARGAQTLTDAPPSPTLPPREHLSSRVPLRH